MFYKNVRNRRGDEGDELVGRKGRRFRNDVHLYGYQNKLNPIALSDWYFGGPGRTWTYDRTIMSPCTVFYTGFHQVILTNINSILTLLFTNTKCYWIVLKIMADRHLSIVLTKGKTHRKIACHNWEAWLKSSAKVLSAEHSFNSFPINFWSCEESEFRLSCSMPACCRKQHLA